MEASRGPSGGPLLPPAARLVMSCASALGAGSGRSASASAPRPVVVDVYIEDIGLDAEALIPHLDRIAEVAYGK